MPNSSKAVPTSSPHAKYSAPLGHLVGGRKQGLFVGTGNFGAQHPSTVPSGAGIDAYEPGKACRVKPLQPHEVQQAAYQLGAKLNGKAVDPRDRSRLAAANEIKHQTSLMLPHGRGNQKEDIDASQRYSHIYTSASYSLEDLDSKNKPATKLGSALAFGAGNCDHNSGISARMYGSKMGPGETVSQINSQDWAHTWSETNAATRPSLTWKQSPPSRPGQPPGAERKASNSRPPSVVMDSWANGPAVRHKDAKWADATDIKTTGTFYNSTQANKARQEMLAARDDYAPHGKKWHLSKLALQENKLENVNSEYDISSQVVHKKFADGTRDGMRKMTRHNPMDEQLIANGVSPQAIAQKKQMHGHMMAAAAGREAYNLNIHTATRPHATQSILDNAWKIDDQGRPAAEAPSRPLI